MTDRTVNNLPAAAHGEPLRCLFAFELSTMSWVIAFNTPPSEKISRRTLTGCKRKRLLELIEAVQARVTRETGRRVEVVSCNVLQSPLRGGGRDRLQTICVGIHRERHARSGRDSVRG